MTEEIIIDGVNVAGCEYLCTNQMGNNCLNHNQGFSMNCKNNNNCYYKQLKRLEQERDEWKKKYEDVANENLKEIYELIKKNDCWRGVVNIVCSKLEQENKELKEKIIELSEEKGHLIVENNTLKEANQSLSMLGTDLASANEVVRKEFFRADKNKDMWRECAENYRSALEEIRKYVSLWKVGKTELDLDTILDKINEVLQ